MNRKNLTAAVLAGLAGAAGIAGTAQAVNLNPDGLGQVLVYPYYSSNAGNDTLLSVVNTTDNAKAVKVRFKEGFNSREVLDFNMYMSAWDVWVAAIADDNGTPTLFIPDTTCTVPYLYGNGVAAGLGLGVQPFLDYAYTGVNADGGPSSIQRAAEGHFEILEMGTLNNDSETAKTLGSADAATHFIDDEGNQNPEDCQQLVDNWTRNPDGMWIDDPSADIQRNSGGLFGGAAIINVGNGTMFSYDARAIQGYDKSDDGVHYEPGSILPNLNSGDQNSATVFFGVPQDTAVTLSGYARPVDAISAVFMHEYTMNEYNIETGLNAGSEWVITFPTKNWYVDNDVVGGTFGWEPSQTDPGCGGWEPGQDFPPWMPADEDDPDQNDPTKPTGWEQCTYVQVFEGYAPIPPFTSVWDGEACEVFGLEVWDREENSGEGANNPRPPIVSPPPPGGSTPNKPNEICYETNVIRFGNDGEFVSVFGTPTIDGDSILKTLDTGSVPYDNGTKSKPKMSGWAKMNWGFGANAKTGYHVDYNGLVGLPVTGFWAEQFTNGFLGTPEASVLANYGGLFNNKGNVRRISPYRSIPSAN